MCVWLSAGVFVGSLPPHSRGTEQQLTDLHGDLSLISDRWAQNSLESSLMFRGRVVLKESWRVKEPERDAKGFLCGTTSEWIPASVQRASRVYRLASGRSVAGAAVMNVRRASERAGSWYRDSVYRGRDICRGVVQLVAVSRVRGGMVVAGRSRAGGRYERMRVFEGEGVCVAKRCDGRMRI